MLVIFRWVFAALLLLKTLDIVDRGLVYLTVPGTVIICALWVAAAVSIGLGKYVRWGAGAIIVLAILVPVLSGMEMYNQHMYLIGSIALALLIGGAAQKPLLRAQLSIVYGFGVITKLNEAFLSGTEIYTSAVARPFWSHFIPIEPTAGLMITISVLAICTEAFLAFAFWLPRARWVAAALGLGFHTVMLVLMTAGPISFVRLTVFGFLMVALYIPFFDRELDALVDRMRARRGKLVEPQPAPRRRNAATA